MQLLNFSTSTDIFLMEIHIIFSSRCLFFLFLTLLGRAFIRLSYHHFVPTFIRVSRKLNIYHLRTGFGFKTKYDVSKCGKHYMNYALSDFINIKVSANTRFFPGHLHCLIIPEFGASFCWQCFSSFIQLQHFKILMIPKLPWKDSIFCSEHDLYLYPFNLHQIFERQTDGQANRQLLKHQFL